MGEIFVVAEHRQGELREITLQMLWKANKLCTELSLDLTTVLIGGKDLSFSQELIERADRVILFEDERLGHFNPDLYGEVLNRVIQERQPFITMIGQTPWGMDLAPSLAVRTGLPIISDCVDILIEGGDPKGIRQIYSGKLFSKVSFKPSTGYLFTVRPGAFR